MKRNQANPRSAGNVSDVGSQRPAQGFGVGMLALCIAAVAVAGCGMRPKPAASGDVCPVPVTLDTATKKPEQSSLPVVERGSRETIWERSSSDSTLVPPVTVERHSPLPEEYASAQLPRRDLKSVREQPSLDAPLMTASFELTRPARPSTASPRQIQQQAQPTSPVELAPTTAATGRAAQPKEARALESRGTPSPEVVMPRLEQPGAADEMVVVNFDGTDIRDVLKTVGELTGINFIPHQSVSGPVTVMSPTAIRLGDLYGFLQTILDVNGYAAIETEHAVRIVPKAEATRSSPIVRLGADPAAIPKNGAIVTQILPLQYAEPAEVKQAIEPMLSADAQMGIYPGMKAIMITDTSANIHHIAQILVRLDVEGSGQQVVLFPLTHASAQVLSEQVTNILEKTRMAQTPPGRPRSGVQEAGPRVLPDERTNSLIAIAPEPDLVTIAGLVEQLDIRRPSGTGNVHVTYLKNADANEVAASLESALPSMKLAGAVEATQQIQVTADSSTNSLIIVASPQDFEVISQIIEKLDIVREQVLVEMLILEVTEEALTEIGVDWATLDEAVANSIRGFGMTNLGPRVSFLNGSLEGLAVGAWQASGSDVRVGAILQALQKESGVNILSTPHILTSNHRRAKIIVGENRPFVMESRITETNDPITPTVIQSFEYKDVGITLQITPHVSQGGLIRLEVDSEFTKLIEDVTTPSPQTPTTAKRTAQTEVTMGSGDTVVIGGLIRDDTISVEKKVPLIGDLPLLGVLFRSRRDLAQKTNLLFFITPHVLANQEELRQMTERKRNEMTPGLDENR